MSIVQENRIKALEKQVGELVAQVAELKSQIATGTPAGRENRETLKLKK